MTGLLFTKDNDTWIIVDSYKKKFNKGEEKMELYDKEVAGLLSCLDNCKKEWKEADHKVDIKVDFDQIHRFCKDGKWNQRQKQWVLLWDKYEPVSKGMKERVKAKGHVVINWEELLLLDRIRKMGREVDVEAEQGIDVEVKQGLSLLNR